MRSLILALAVGLFAHSVSASVVTYRFQGQVTGSSGIFSGQPSLDVSGTFSFDTQLQDLYTGPPSGANGYQDDAFFNYWSPNGPLTSSFVATLDYGSVHLSLSSPPAPGVGVASLWFTNNALCGTGPCLEDQVYYQVRPDLPAGTVRDFHLKFLDRKTDTTRPNGIPDGVLDNTTNGGQTILGSLNPAAFSFMHEGAWIENNAGNGDGTLLFNVTQVTPVPIPAALWLLGSGLVGLLGAARGRRHSA
jgi:hypothetical protein